MKVFNGGDVLVIVLEKGEKVVESLKKVASERDAFGFFKGIGAVKWAELAYGDAETGEYLIEKHSDGYEVLGLNGNITLDENGDVLVHAHIVLGDREHRAFGGHLVEGEVSITLEVFLVRTGLRLQRKRLGYTSFKIIDREV